MMGVDTRGWTQVEEALLPSGPHCFQSSIPIVVLLLLMMLVWVEAPRAEDCPVCNSYA